MIDIRVESCLMVIRPCQKHKPRGGLGRKSQTQRTAKKKEPNPKGGSEEGAKPKGRLRGKRHTEPNPEGSITIMVFFSGDYYDHKE